MGYAAWHSSFIPPGFQVRSPLTVPGQYKGLRPCGGMYPLTRVGFLETSSPVRRGEGGGGGKGGPLWAPASCSLCSPVGQRGHAPSTGRPYDGQASSATSSEHRRGDGLSSPCHVALVLSFANNEPCACGAPLRMKLILPYPYFQKKVLYGRPRCSFPSKDVDPGIIRD